MSLGVKAESVRDSGRFVLRCQGGLQFLPDDGSPWSLNAVHRKPPSVISLTAICAASNFNRRVSPPAVGNDELVGRAPPALCFRGEVTIDGWRTDYKSRLKFPTAILVNLPYSLLRKHTVAIGRPIIGSSFACFR